MQKEKESLLKRLQMRLLPPSSRSYHDRTDMLTDQLKRIEDAVGGIEYRTNEIYRSMAHLHKRVSELAEVVDIQEARQDIQLKTLYKQENETDEEAKRRFFANIAPSEGDKRLFQLAIAKLMEELHQICKTNNLDYWFCFGTLVAAISREGFIPWDDDIDICMMRSDAEKLMDILKDDETYQITVVYDYHVLCKQVRFSLKDPNIPCFIDICVWDWVRDTAIDHEEEFRALRLELMEILPAEKSGLTYWKERTYLFAPESGFVAQAVDIDLASQDKVLAKKETDAIEAIFAEYQKKAFDAGILCDKSEAQAVGYALENIYDAPWRRVLWPQEMIFPCKPVTFEEYSFGGPADALAVLDECYPGWPYLPYDLLSHTHFADGFLSNKATVAAMKEFVNGRSQ